MFGEVTVKKYEVFFFNLLSDYANVYIRDPP